MHQLRKLALEKFWLQFACLGLDKAFHPYHDA
jgi:hypothetical protein